MKNFELKAAAPDLDRLRRVLRTIGARRQRPLAQTDTYFTVPAGRLKLRQRKGARGAELIAYVRADEKKARQSEYQKLAVEDAPGLTRLLSAMFGEDVRVTKIRDLWMYGATRVHLDTVDGLGTFVEIEVPCEGSSARARRTMKKLVDALGIVPGEVMDCSYSDMLRAAGGTRPQAGGTPAPRRGTRAARAETPAPRAKR